MAPDPATADPLKPALTDAACGVRDPMTRAWLIRMAGDPDAAELSVADDGGAVPAEDMRSLRATLNQLDRPASTGVLL